MQPALDRAILDRLIVSGRRQGYLTNEDLAANLPIGSMSADEIAMIVVHLEELGIPVELEERLLSPDAKPASAPTRTAEIIPFPDPSAKKAQRKTPPLRTTSLSASERFNQGDHTNSRAHWAVMLAGLAVLVLLLGILSMASG
jgi:hypothetical protein